MTAAIKIAVAVDGRGIGYLRRVGNEVLVAASYARGTKYDISGPDSAAVTDMLAFEGPERATSKSKEPVISFRFIRT